MNFFNFLYKFARKTWTRVADESAMQPSTNERFVVVCLTNVEGDLHYEHLSIPHKKESSNDEVEV